MTTGERWDRVKQIFQDAIAQPEEARRELVEWYAEGDASIIEEVESLLAAYAEAEAADARAEARDDEPLGQRVGAYRIVEEIGRGGMGAIYRAVREGDEHQTDVAVKVIKRGMDTDAVLRRFRQERQILADLDHPNIAQLLDGGTTEAGVPYFVMEYIDGEPLDAYCAAHQLDLRQRLKLFQDICEAVDYAQRRGVVHRDIKPGNILISRDGVPKLLDFGIAKLLGPTTDRTASATVAGHQILTPAYASPEQLAGEKATPASDVYSLGIVLYELLTGKRPFDDHGTPTQLARLRQTTNPARPSDTRDEQRRRRLQLRGDLDDIVMMALDPAPQRRYACAGDLGGDVARHLAGEPVVARRRSVATRARGFVRRHRSRLIAAAAVVAIAVAALTFRAMLRPRATDVQSVAVLPLVTMGPDTEHLGLGIADAIIVQLSAIPGLTVRPTSAVRQYAAVQTRDSVAIGRRLRVDAVLEGTLRRVGDRVRVTVQLVGVRDARPIWSGKFDRAAADVLLFEDAISAEVTRAISRDKDATIPQPKRTVDPQAYQAYLRGRYFWNQRTFDSFRKAIGYFEDAIRRDPSYAAAHAGLADSYLLLGWANAGPADQLFPLAKRSAFRALQLDERLAEAHTSLAQIKYIYDWDFEGAEKEFRRAIDLDPNYATGRQWYALFLSAMDRHDEAVSQITLALQADPVSRVINMNYAGILAGAGRINDSIEAYKRAIEVDPNFGNVWSALGSAYLEKHEYEKALAAFEQARRLYDDKPARLSELATVHALMGNRSKALGYLFEMKSLEGKTHVPPVKYASVYAALGDNDHAFEELERAYRDRSPDILGLGDFDSLRADPRYESLRKRIGLPR